MTDDKTALQLSTREFIDRLRSELAAAGRPDIKVQRNWLQRDEAGDRFALYVPVGAEAVVPLCLPHEADEAAMSAAQGEHAAVFAKALINVNAAEKRLGKYLGEIRQAASAAVEAARINGLDIKLEKVGFYPVSALHLTGRNCNAAADYVLAAVTVRHLAHHLRPDETTFRVEEAADVAREMDGVLEDQRERQDRLADLEAAKADLVVDQITLDLLEAHEIDPAVILAKLSEQPSSTIIVQHDGRDLPLLLMNYLGEATITVAMQDAVWNGEYLWFLGDEEMKDHKHLVGKSLGALVRHPVFASRAITKVERGYTDHIHFDLSDKMLFDADTGRFWRDRKLVA